MKLTIRIRCENVDKFYDIVMLKCTQQFHLSYCQYRKSMLFIFHFDFLQGDWSATVSIITFVNYTVCTGSDATVVKINT